MSNGSIEGDYEVGYGKPPVATRFKPGQSGNPKGARRKVRPSNLGEAVEAALMRRQTVMIDGKRKRMSRLEIMAERITLDAAKGDLEAQRELIKIHQFHTRLDRQYPRCGDSEQIVDVHLKIGDEKVERQVEERLIEERIKELRALRLDKGNA